VKLAGVVLAAGTGRRLSPLTDYVPKPLLPILDRPLIGCQIERLQEAGVEQVFVNTHHHADAVARYLARNAPEAVHRRESRLTGPAGALLLFAEELSSYDAILVASSDILLGAGLGRLVDAHLESGAVFTFGVVETTGARRFGVLELDGSGVVQGAREKPDVPDHEQHPVSAGVYCSGPEAIDEIARLAASLDTVDFARDLAPALLTQGSRVAGCRLGGYWRDVGTPSSYRAANRDALAGKVPFQTAPPPGQHDPEWVPPVYVHPEARVGPGVRIEGPVVVGSAAEIGAGAHLVDAVVLPGGTVPATALVHGGVVGPAAVPGLERQKRAMDEVGAR
jgi:NDP-sugar pyrophosphorylase family protein